MQLWELKCQFAGIIRASTIYECLYMYTRKRRWQYKTSRVTEICYNDETWALLRELEIKARKKDNEISLECERILIDSDIVDRLKVSNISAISEF